LSNITLETSVELKDIFLATALEVKKNCTSKIT